MQFAEKYKVDGSEYDRIYDVFGTLRNAEYLKKIKVDYKARKEYERQTRKERRSYYENFHGNYRGYSFGDGSGYGISLHDNYTNEERALLKQFYRELSKKLHPDSNPDCDTSEHMKLLNRLKGEWGL